MLDVRKLTKHFGGVTAIDELELEVNEGEILGIIGPNGAGKTTLTNLVTGVYHADSGSIKYDGKEISRMKSYDICRMGISRTYQIVKIFEDSTVLNNVVTAAFARTRSVAEAKEEAERQLNFVSLWEKKDEIAKNLTFVDKKKIQIGQALSTKPKLLFLDEAFAGLNPNETLEAIELVHKIADKKITIVLIEHVMKVVMSVCQRIVVLNFGKKIAEGRPEEIVANEEVVEAYLGKGINAQKK